MPKKTAKKTKKNTKRIVKKAAKKATKKVTKKVVRKSKPTVVATPQVVVAPPVVVEAPVVPVAPPPAPVPVPMSNMIWNEIENMPLQMFGLPGQTVAMHCTPVPIEPSKLYVSIRSQATLPALETALSDRFIVEMVDKWVAIALKPQPLTQAKR